MFEPMVTKQRKWRRGAMLALALLGPLVLFAALTWHEAVHRQQQEAAVAARAIETQVVSIVTDAREAAMRLVPLALEPCGALVPELMRRNALVPYVRSLSVIDGDHVSCSSALGLRPSALSMFRGMPSAAPRTPWAAIVESTPSVPERPALVIGEPAANARAVIAVVDDRYLRDLLHAAAPPGAFHSVELRIGEGVPLAGQSPVADDVGRVLADEHFDAAGAPVSLRIVGLRSRLVTTWTALLQQSMPIAIVLAGLLGWLTYQREASLGSWREQLLGAIRRDEFHVVYQPVYQVATQRCYGAEALLRWNRPGSGPVSPDVFIEAAERSQMAVPLTLHLLELIAADLRDWTMPPGFHLGVNFTAEHLSDERCIGDLRPFMNDMAARQYQFVLEITERTLMNNTQQARRNLDTLRERGVKVAIDDFGTGYCSLSYLETFPFDLLKVDRGFVMTIDPERGPAIVLDAIISLAHQLKAKVVAEGVNRAAEFDYLAARRVSYMQGYLYAEPMRSADFLAWYARAGQQPFEPSVAPAARA